MFVEKPVDNLKEHRTILYKYDGKFEKGNGGSKEDLFNESKIKHWTADPSTLGKKLYGK